MGPEWFRDQPAAAERRAGAAPYHAAAQVHVHVKLRGHELARHGRDGRGGAGAKGIAALGARRKMLKTFEAVRAKMGVDSPGGANADSGSAGDKNE